jgi:hypothetical protein
MLVSYEHPDLRLWSPVQPQVVGVQHLVLRQAASPQVRQQVSYQTR